MSRKFRQYIIIIEKNHLLVEHENEFEISTKMNGMRHEKETQKSKQPPTTNSAIATLMDLEEGNDSLRQGVHQK